MSVYNGSSYLKESIESILNQSFTDFEFIIINDCSTDDSENIIAEYAAQDRRVKLYNNQANIGLTKSLNIALNKAQGKYIARQDADDISTGDRFAKQVPVLEQEPEVVLVSCNLDIIDSQGNFITTEKRSCDSFWIPWYLIFYNCIGGHSQVIFRKDRAIALGGYCEDYIYSQDYEFWCRLVKTGKMVILPEVLLKRRNHAEGITFTKRSKQLDYAFNISSRNLKYLINEELCFKELKDLKQFWSGHINSNFPDITKLNYIDSRQRQISQAFLAKAAFVEQDKPEIAKQLKRLIGKQFTSWVRSLSILYNLPSRIKVSQYTLNWNAKALIVFWLQEIYIRPIKMISTLVFMVFGEVRGKE